MMSAGIHPGAQATKDIMNDDVHSGGRARLSQERSRQRRDQLVQAAARLFAEGGTKAITHRAVSEAAGVPLATVSYYFASIDQLVDVMFLETITRWREEWAGLRPEEGQALAADEVGERFRSLIVSLTDGGHARNLNVYLASLLRPALRADIDDMRTEVQGAMVALVSAVGVADPGPTVRTLSLLYSGALVALADANVEPASVGDLLRYEVTRAVELGIASHAAPGSSAAPAASPTEPEPV